MKKIGLISDTHGFLDPQVYQYFSEVDEIWHAGDIGSIDIISKLREFKPFRGVYGNIDDGGIRKECPEHERFLCEGVDVWMTHIGGRPGKYPISIKEVLESDPPKVFICGHSHICKVEFDKKYGMLYLNPGAAGNQGFHKMKTLLRFSVDNENISDMEVVELGKRG